VEGRGTTCPLHLNRFITVTERARKSEGNIERFLKNLIGHVLALFSLAPSGPLPGDGRGYKGLDDSQDGSRHREHQPCLCPFTEAEVNLKTE